MQYIQVNSICIIDLNTAAIIVSQLQQQHQVNWYNWDYYTAPEVVCCLLGFIQNH